MSNDSNAAIWKAYPNSQVDLWDQNFVNGEYVIAYELSPGLDRKLQKMLPKVSFVLFVIFVEVCRNIRCYMIHIRNYICISHEKYIAIISNKSVNLIGANFRQCRKSKKRHASSLKKEAKISIRKGFY